MTKTELKCIELIIDKYTKERDDIYGNCHKRIYGEDIPKIKKEIAELVEDNK